MKTVFSTAFFLMFLNAFMAQPVSFVTNTSNPFFSILEATQVQNIDKGGTNSEFAPTAGPKIGLKGKLHRAIKNRPRDGKECDCKHCFGVCDLGVEVSWEFSSLIVQPNGNTVGSGQATIYFLENPVESESEFVIDADLSVPPAALAATTLTSLILKAGTYQYNSTQVTIEVGGESVTSYGTVVVDSVTQ
jgi:hypothetical protein